MGAIAALQQQAHLLVVQRTGWKSIVYFLTTRLLRDQPYALVSPLLALMRNQIAAAGRMGVRAATINSSNKRQWVAVQARLLASNWIFSSSLQKIGK